MFENLEKTILSAAELSVSNERKIILSPLIVFIQNKVEYKKQIRLNFICTHNSRRSHLAQVWSQTLAFYFKIDNVFCYSGGTETTALFTKVIETLINQGFKSLKLSDFANPIYAIKFNENEAPIIGFSKSYDSQYNPKNDFAAILTCSQADSGCPFIAGAEVRIPITFEDPKAFDDSTFQSQKYTERSLQIASELFYVFSQIKK
jgi:arsenate reductase